MAFKTEKIQVTGDVSISGALLYDASINDVSVAYTIAATDRNKFIDASGTFTITLPNSLSTGFEIAVFNSGPGTITFNASTLLAADASVVIRKRYGAATAIHKGSGLWYLMGNLE